MSHNLYLVFSSPPRGVPAQDYDRWYDKHVRENIVSPGFVSGRRYEVEPARNEPGGFTHLALYEYDGDIGIWRSDLDARIARKEIDLPDWFPQIHFGSWSARPLTDRIVPVR